VNPDRGLLRLVSTIDELLGRKNCCSDLESREYSRRHPSRCPRGTLYPQMLSLTSPTSGGRSVGIVRLQAQTTEFVYLLFFMSLLYLFLLVSLKLPNFVRSFKRSLIFSLLAPASENSFQMFVTVTSLLTLVGTGSNSCTISCVPVQYLHESN
jgi:hypothetical protein